MLPYCYVLLIRISDLALHAPICQFLRASVLCLCSRTNDASWQMAMSFSDAAALQFKINFINRVKGFQFMSVTLS